MENVEVENADVLGMIQAFAETQNEFSPGSETVEQAILKIPPEEQENMRNDILITQDDINKFLSTVEKIANGT